MFKAQPEVEQREKAMEYIQKLSISSWNIKLIPPALNSYNSSQASEVSSSPVLSLAQVQ